MKNFFISIGKAACYALLLLAVQFIVGSVYIYAVMFAQLIKDGVNLASFDASTIDALTENVTETTLASQNMIYLISAVLIIGILILFFRMRSKRLDRETWAMPIKISSLWPVVVLGVFFSLFICYVVAIIPWPEWAIDSYDELYAATNDFSAVAFITTVIAAPILEEIVYRGLVFTRLCRGMPAPAAAILASVVFAAMHGTLVWMAYAFVGSMMLIFVYTKYRSLYASILFHILFNLVGGFLILLIPQYGAGFDRMLMLASFVLTVLTVFIIVKMPREKIDKIAQ